jgi:hypothetical protein
MQKKLIVDDFICYYDSSCCEVPHIWRFGQHVKIFPVYIPNMKDYSTLLRTVHNIKLPIGCNNVCVKLYDTDAIYHLAIVP